MSFQAFLLRRVLLFVFVLLGLSFLTFVLMIYIPGDPAAMMLASYGGSVVSVEELQARWGLDQPIHIQYVRYITNVLKGDLGRSLASGRKISEELGESVPATAELAFASMAIIVVVGIPMGVVCAIKRNSWIDNAVRIGSLLGMSMPIFWIAIVALVIFYLKLGWVPVGQRIDFDLSVPRITRLYLLDSVLARDWKAATSVVRHLILPAILLAYSGVGRIIRIQRASMLDVLGLDYVRTARGKGLKERSVIYRHALRNAMIPTVTALGVSFGTLLSGAVLIEAIFAWPGLGRFTIQSIGQQDLPAVVGATLVIGVSYSVINLIVDVIVARLDPRIVY